MKKVFYAFLALVLSMGSILLEKDSGVAAESIISRVDMIPDVYAEIKLANGEVHKSNFGYIYANDQLSYCVEPIKIIDSNEALEISTTLDAETRERLSIISYHGYNQSVHKSDKWYIATQLMIWEALGNTFTLHGFDDYGIYKKQIEDSIASHHTLPSFVNAQITLEEGVKTDLFDEANVLSQFSNIQHDGAATMSVNGNTLQLEAKSNQYGEGTIQINKFLPEQLGLPIVYRGQGNDSVQQIIYPQISQNVSGSLTYRVQPYGYIKLNKTGEILSGVGNQESGFGVVHKPLYQKQTLQQVEVGVYAKEDVYDVWGNRIYAKNTQVDTLMSGKKEVSEKLPAGKYYVKELKTAPGYVLDEKEYVVEIGMNQETKANQEVHLYNERSHVKLKLHKTFEEGSLLDVKEAYQDVQFGIYAKHDIYNQNQQLMIKANDLVYLSGINQDGYLLEEADLPLGEYYLKELSTNKHYVLDENSYPFRVEANGQRIIEITIGNGDLENKLHRNELTIHKVDKESEKPLSAKFVLYDEMMNEIETFMSDEHGSYVFEELIDGVYYLQEIEAPEGYKLNPKLHKITLMEDLTYTMDNEKIPEKEKKTVVVETNDQANHRPIEVMMLSSMSIVYAWVLRKLKI